MLSKKQGGYVYGLHMGNSRFRLQALCAWTRVFGSDSGENVAEAIEIQWNDIFLIYYKQ